MANESRERDEKFSNELKSLYAPPFDVPTKIDDAILNRARAEMARRTRWRPVLWAGSIAAAACAAIVVAVWNQNAPSPAQQASGQITIVDAFKLAKQIQNGGGRDINHDGKIDQSDVDAIAMSAVQLKGGVQ